MFRTIRIVDPRRPNCGERSVLVVSFSIFCSRNQAHLVADTMIEAGGCFSVSAAGLDGRTASRSTREDSRCRISLARSARFWRARRSRARPMRCARRTLRTKLAMPQHSTQQSRTRPMIMMYSSEKPPTLPMPSPSGPSTVVLPKLLTSTPNCAAQRFVSVTMQRCGRDDDAPAASLWAAPRPTRRSADRRSATTVSDAALAQRTCASARRRASQWPPASAH